MTSVLDGPRREIRRIFHQGGAQWVSVSDEGAELLLYDGRRVDESETYMAPCDPDQDPVHPPQLRQSPCRVPGDVADDVWEYVAGFMPSNDVGLHDFRDTDGGSMLRVKGHDGYCPVGPGLVSGIDITGTPANSRPMNIGDVVEVEVTDVGRLTNTVAESPAPLHRVGHQPTATNDVVRVARGGDWWAERDAERALATAAERN